MGNQFARGLGKALLGAAIFAVALATTPASAETVLKRGFGASPDTLDPHMNYGAREGWIQDDMYEGLIAGDVKGEMGEGAANKWEVSDDGLTWTFHLRDGLKWSNGTRWWRRTSSMASSANWSPRRPRRAPIISARLFRW